MADIFISYASRDREKARRLAIALKDRGWSIWWDRELESGTPFDEKIEQELSSARCVVVGWSSAALNSRWVRAEAADARKREVIVPVLFERIEPPLMFRQIYTADMSNWGGDFTSESFTKLVKSIQAKIDQSSLDKESGINSQSLQSSEKHGTIEGQNGSGNIGKTIRLITRIAILAIIVGISLIFAFQAIYTEVEVSAVISLVGLVSLFSAIAIEAAIRKWRGRKRIR